MIGTSRTIFSENPTAASTRPEKTFSLACQMRPPLRFSMTTSMAGSRLRNSISGFEPCKMMSYMRVSWTISPTRCSLKTSQRRHSIRLLEDRALCLFSIPLSRSMSVTLLVTNNTLCFPMTFSLTNGVIERWPRTLPSQFIDFKMIQILCPQFSISTMTNLSALRTNSPSWQVTNQNSILRWRRSWDLTLRLSKLIIDRPTPFLILILKVTRLS